MKNKNLFKIFAQQPEQGNINLKEIRKRIDRIDEQIVDLLEKRFSLVLETAFLKDQVKDKKREAAILNRLTYRLSSYNYVSRPLINQIYSLIFQESLKLQKNKINLNKQRNHLKDQKEKRSMAEVQSKEGLPEIKKIVILGVGRMGSWLAREVHPIAEVAIFDQVKEKMLALSGIRKLTSIKEIKSFCPDLLINAVSLQKTVDAFEEVLPFLSSRCILADIASVKGELPRYYQKWSRPYVSTHPMFGPTFAHLQQLSQENAIIIRESDERGKHFFRQFYRQFGINLYEYSFDEHDKIIAYSLTIPFVSTMVFAACLEMTAVPGTTFRKHLEIARGLLNEDDYLLAEILFNHFSLPQVERITQRLEFLKHIIRQKDYEEATNFFHRLRANIKA